MTRLFLYGTLMRGERNHLQLRGSPCLGPARTIAAYTLYDLGAYPALAAAGHASVAGELYDVPPELLAALDRFEGVPELYQRVEVRLAGGGTAQGYAMPVERLAGRPNIPSGDWRVR
jgi:gamma-glutamylcyclotransferase (GGCT)/AIG2-like uncharacterized protein YtfP